MPKTPEQSATSAPATATDEVSRFEQAMGELEAIVARMESGDLRLEESLQLFERGMVLTRQCRQSLEAAELKVRNLLAAENGSSG